MKKNIFQSMKKTSRKNLVTYLICFSFFAAVQIMDITDNLTRHFSSLLVPICINVILAVSLNLVIGFLGELSLGHAGFMCIGAYAAGIITKMVPNFGGFMIGILVGFAISAVVALIVSIPSASEG